MSCSLYLLFCPLLFCILSLVFFLLFWLAGLLNCPQELQCPLSVLVHSSGGNNLGLKLALSLNNKLVGHLL